MHCDEAYEAESDVCSRCGERLQIGDYPFCPHGKSSLVTVQDSIPGGLVVHNLGPTPVTVYSHSERRDIMRARGLVEKVHHVDGDRHVGRMV